MVKFVEFKLTIQGKKELRLLNVKDISEISIESKEGDCDQIWIRIENSYMHEDYNSYNEMMTRYNELKTLLE